MDLRPVAGILASGLYVFVVTFLFLIPGRGLWNALASGSEAAFFGGLLLACVGFGAAFAALAGIGAARVLGGGLAAYALWLVFLEVTAGPFESPAHLVVGIVFLVGFGGGAAVADRTRRAGFLPGLEPVE